MGNIFAKRDKKYYEKFIDNNGNSNELHEVNDLQSKYNNLLIKYENLDSRICGLDSYYSKKSGDLLDMFKSHEIKIEAIMNDLQALMNNDKLLLEKLIEKNIVSVIENH